MLIWNIISHFKILFIFILVACYCTKKVVECVPDVWCWFKETFWHWETLTSVNPCWQETAAGLIFLMHFPFLNEMQMLLHPQLNSCHTTMQQVWVQHMLAILVACVHHRLFWGQLTLSVTGQSTTYWHWLSKERPLTWSKRSQTLWKIFIYCINSLICHKNKHNKMCCYWQIIQDGVMWCYHHNVFNVTMNVMYFNHL